MLDNIHFINKFKSLCLLQGRSLDYLLRSFLIIIFSTIVIHFLDWLPSFIKAVLAITSILLSIHFFLLSYKMTNSILKQPPDGVPNKRVLNISSGTYNETLNVHGNYIHGDNIVGDKVLGDKNIYSIFYQLDLNQLSNNEIKQKITEVLQSTSQENFAKQKIVDELISLSYENDAIERKLVELTKFLGLNLTNDIVETAEQIIDFLAPDTKTSFWDIDTDSEKNKKLYRRLIYLLEASKWKEGDEETVRIIKKLMPHSIRRSGCMDINIKVIEASVKQLQAINSIWLEASGGRFGFSVQQRIWNKINRLKNDADWMEDKSEYDIFAEQVKWSNDLGVIYHIDFDYKITSAKGSLPAKILLLESYDPNSNYCRLSHCLFDVLMARRYSDYSYIPAKIREWLVLD
jgi:hypothetical protein